MSLFIYLFGGYVLSDEGHEGTSCPQDACILAMVRETSAPRMSGLLGEQWEHQLCQWDRGVDKLVGIHTCAYIHAYS